MRITRRARIRCQNGRSYHRCRERDIRLIPSAIVIIPSHPSHPRSRRPTRTHTKNNRPIAPFLRRTRFIIRFHTNNFPIQLPTSGSLIIRPLTHTRLTSGEKNNRRTQSARLHCGGVLESIERADLSYPFSSSFLSCCSPSPFLPDTSSPHSPASIIPTLSVLWLKGSWSIVFIQFTVQLLIHQRCTLIIIPRSTNREYVAMCGSSLPIVHSSRRVGSLFFVLVGVHVPTFRSRRKKGKAKQKKTNSGRPNGE